MPKGDHMYQCDQCKKYIIEGIEDGLLVFCDEKCRRAHSSTGRTEDSKSSDRGSSPREPATIPGEAFERMAIDLLIGTLHQSDDDPDFPGWKLRAEGLFKRYAKLKESMSKPLGETWADENKHRGVTGYLDLIERKIKAVEAMFGLT